VGKRKLVGTLRGYDQFMNLVVEDAVEQVSLTEKNEIGTVVIRGARAASQRRRRPRRSRAAPQATPSRTSSSWSEKRRSTDARATSSARRGIKSDVT